MSGKRSGKFRDFGLDGKKAALVPAGHQIR